MDELKCNECSRAAVWQIVTPDDDDAQMLSCAFHVGMVNSGQYLTYVLNSIGNPGV